MEAREFCLSVLFYMFFFSSSSSSFLFSYVEGWGRGKRVASRDSFSRSRPLHHPISLKMTKKCTRAFEICQTGASERKWER